MVIESQLSVKWDTTKTKRYQQEIPIYLIGKNKGIGILSNSGLFCSFG